MAKTNDLTTPVDQKPVDESPPARRPLYRTWFLFPVSLLAGLLLWTLLSSVVPVVLFPPPWTVAAQAGQLVADGDLWHHAFASIRRVLTGYSLGIALAIPVGFLMGWYRWARALFDPWVQFFRTVPALAFIPLVIVIVGIGESAKVTVIFFASFLACVVAVFDGVRNVDRTILNAARVLGAGDATIFRRVVIPASSPYVFVGMRLALGNAWGTLVAAELIAASRGLGKMMQTASLFFDVATIMVGILAIGVIGLTMDRILTLVADRMTAWQERR